MKQLLYILFLGSLLFYASCNVLDIEPSDKYSESVVWEDEDLVTAYVSAQYRAVLEDYGENIRETASDNLYALHNWGQSKHVLEGSVTADNVTSLMTQYNIWSHAYSNIRNYNIFLEKMETSPIEEKLKERFKGEIKFLRAYLYAEMIIRYGGVPIITKVFDLNGDYSVNRNSFDECVKFVVEELDQAIALLGVSMQKESELGRASGHACMALKSRLLLYAASPLWNETNSTEKWEKAAQAAAALMNPEDVPAGISSLADYSLEEDYQQLFLKSTNNQEIIFARYFTQSQPNEISNRQGRNGSGGMGGANPTQNIVNAYEMINGEMPYLDDDYTIINPLSGYDPSDPYKNPRDPRFEASILHDGSIWQGRETQAFLSNDQNTVPGGMDSSQGQNMPANASATSYYLKKFVPEEIPTVGSSVKSTNPYIIFRYAEILLNYAEAQYYLGNEDAARLYINKVRARKSVHMPPVKVSGEELLKKIQNERRIELAFEGHRYFDVRRWKLAEKTEVKPMLGMKITKDITGNKSYEFFKLPIVRPNTFDPRFYLLPIPRTEIEKVNNHFSNNPGY